MMEASLRNGSYGPALRVYVLLGGRTYKNGTIVMKASVLQSHGESLGVQRRGNAGWDETNASSGMGPS